MTEAELSSLTNDQFDLAAYYIKHGAKLEDLDKKRIIRQAKHTAWQFHLSIR